MAKYRIEGTIVDTHRASQSWEESTDWDGKDHISRATGSQWNHQRLHRSRRGRYYLETWSQWQGYRPHAEWISPQEAARWLLQMDEDLPADLRQYEDEVSE